MNRCFRRLARMSGRAVPEDTDLLRKLHQRMHLLSRDQSHHHHHHHHNGSDSGSNPESGDNSNPSDGSNDPGAGSGLDSGGVESVSNATTPTAPDSLGVDIELVNVLCRIINFLQIFFSTIGPEMWGISQLFKSEHPLVISG